MDKIVVIMCNRIKQLMNSECSVCWLVPSRFTADPMHYNSEKAGSRGVYSLCLRVGTFDFLATSESYQKRIDFHPLSVH